MTVNYIIVGLVLSIGGGMLCYLGGCWDKDYLLSVIGLLSIAMGLESLSRIWFAPWKKIGIALVVALFIGGGLSSFRHSRELVENGKNTTGIVTDEFHAKRSKTLDGRFIHYTYTVDGLQYRIEEETDSYKVGDTIVITYSVACPEISKIHSPDE